jgi:hypothetical protein
LQVAGWTSKQTFNETVMTILDNPDKIVPTRDGRVILKKQSLPYICGFTSTGIPAHRAWVVARDSVIISCFPVWCMKYHKCTKCMTLPIR